MFERGEKIRISFSLNERAEQKGQDFSAWFDDALSLALAVDAGSVFQLIGGGYERLKITDLKPFMQEAETRDHYELKVTKKTFEGFGTQSSPKEMTLRVITLGILAEAVPLYFFDGEEYNRIEFTPDTKE